MSSCLIVSVRHISNHPNAHMSVFPRNFINFPNFFSIFTAIGRPGRSESSTSSRLSKHRLCYTKIRAFDVALSQNASFNIQNDQLEVFRLLQAICAAQLLTLP